MAQIIKHRRGTLAELNGVTLNNGELGIVTSSVASIGDAVLKTAVVVGNTDGTNRLSIGRIIKGNATPNLSGITGGSAFNDMLYHETDAKTLKVLNTGGNTSLDLTGNIADGTVGGTLDVTGRVDAQAGLDVTGSLNIGGNTVLGDASGDSLTINAATINTANIAAGTDNTVVVYNGSTLVTDEIDSRVWGTTLVDTDGSGANNELVTWSDSDSIIGEGNLTFDGSTLTVTGNTVVSSHISSSANITGSAIYASSGFYGDGSNLTGVAQDIDTLASYGAATIHQTDDEFLISDNGTEKRITFSNLEDSIFANISGDISIAAGGAATVTGATTNAALTAGAGISTSNGTFNGASAVTFALDLNELTAEQIATGDTIAFNDAGDNGQHKETIDDIATLFAGDGLQASSAVMAVDVSDFAGTGLEDDSSENLRLAAQGTGISGGAGSTLSITPAQTAITSIYNTALKIGRASGDTYIDMGTADDNIDFYAGATKIIDLTTSGIDVTGALTVSSNATITGNLTVNGTTTFISSSQLDIGDNIIVLNSVSGSGRDDAGIQVIDRVGTAHTGSLLWNSTNDYWHSGISGSTHYRHPVQAAAGDLTENKPVIVDGSGRLESSANITDDGTTVNMGVSTHVTGSVYVSAGASVTAASASLVSFRNDSTTQLGYLASADTQAVTTGLVGYNTSTGNLTISSVIDGGSF